MEDKVAKVGNVLWSWVGFYDQFLLKLVIFFLVYHNYLQSLNICTADWNCSEVVQYTDPDQLETSKKMAG